MCERFLDLRQLHQLFKGLLQVSQRSTLGQEQQVGEDADVAPVGDRWGAQGPEDLDGVMVITRVWEYPQQQLFLFKIIDFLLQAREEL